MAKYQLLDWQKEDVETITQRNFLLAHDCGLGKTLIAVEAGKKHAKGPILVVAPRLTKEWWAEVVAAQDAGYAGVCGRAGRDIPWNKIANWKGDKLVWVIVHPTAVRMNYKQMRAIKWDTIIVDEAHRFKNRNAKQTRALWRLDARRKIMMTATPYGKAPDDMWALLHWLYPSKYTSYWRFYEKYVDYFKVNTSNRSFRKVSGPKNLPQLAKEIEPFYLKRRKDDVLDLPPVTYIDRPVIINGKQEELYVQLAQEAYAELHGKEVILSNALVRFLRLQQCALDPVQLAEDLPAYPVGEVPAKVEWLQEWLEDHPEEPVVITSRYRTFVENWLMDIAPEAVVVGGMSTREVSKALKKFEQTGRLVGTLDAIKEGLNLQRAATMIITDGTYSSVAEYQLQNRIHRVGQKHPCQVIHLVGKLATSRKWTVDMLMRRAVQDKFDQAELVDNFIRDLKEI